MQQGMDRLSSFLQRRRWLVIGAWVALLAASLPFMVRQTEDLTSGGFAVPGSGSDAVDRALAGFELAERHSLSVVFARRAGGDAADVRRELVRADRIVDRMPNAELAPRALAAARADAARSPIAIARLATAGDANVAAELAVDLRERLGVGGGPRDGVETYLVGQAALWAGMQDLSKDDLAKAEATGFPLILLILLAVFGSLAAASLPLALGFVSVAITGAGIFLLSQATEMSVFVTNVASMIGIGVAVDYSLFILARYREEVRRGAGAVEARRVALRTSGVAVAFSGTAVILSLAGLFLVDSTVLRSMAMGAIMVVAVSVLAAITFLPALIAIAGRRAHEPGRAARVVKAIAGLGGRLRRRRGAPTARRPAGPGGFPPAAGGADAAEPMSPTSGPDGFWERWTARVTRRPAVTALVAAAVMLTLAVPALSLTTGDGALRQFPAGNETRVGAELAAKKLGAGAAGPVQVVARFRAGSADDPANRRALAALRADAERDREVAAAGRPLPARDGRSALVEVFPRHDPESPAARALVERLRDGTVGGALATVADVEVGGATASVEDFREQVTGSLWKILLFVLALSYLVLLVLLRSVLLPLKAVAMNLLSVGAAYGVLVAIFQYGWIDGLLGFQSLGYVNTMTPPLLLAIVFGLSMDYEVFLLSRIKERYAATRDTTTAVAQGLARSAATISSAAAIMVCVFSVFAGVGVPSVKEIGVGLAVAIALDATIVRLVLVPATMELMGRWNWWLPAPLERILPAADFEASAPAPAAPEPTLDGDAPADAEPPAPPERDPVPA